MLILVLLGMYFDALVVFVTSQSLFFRLALAILWGSLKKLYLIEGGYYIVPNPSTASSFSYLT